MTTQDCFYAIDASTTPCVIVLDNPNMDYASGIFLFFGLVIGVMLLFKKRT